MAQWATLRLTGAQVLAWRLRRHLLEPVGDLAGPEVVERVGAIPRRDLEAEAARLGAIVGRQLRVAVEVV